MWASPYSIYSALFLVAATGGFVTGACIQLYS